MRIVLYTRAVARPRMASSLDQKSTHQHQLAAQSTSGWRHPAAVFSCLHQNGPGVQMTTLNESPVLLLLETAPQPGQRDLPVRLFESGVQSTPRRPVVLQHALPGRMCSNEPHAAD